ncbi:phosphatase PAP2 family protein [Kaarinaea lacus]
METLLKKINHFDLVAFQWCLSRKHARQLAIVSRWVSHTGDGIYYVLIGIIVALLEPVLGLSFFLTGILAYSIELPLYVVLKNSIKRRRPDDVLTEFVAFLIPSDKFSFPSGHTAAAFVMATLISFFYPSLSLLAYSAASIIGFSRVLLGVHFPSDILAGALLGTFSTLLAVFLSSFWL